MNSSPSSHQFKLPTFSSSTGGGFVLPNLGNLSLSPSGSTSLSSLSDFAKTQNNTLGSKNSFTIPNLFSSQQKSTSISQQKTEIENNRIDLMSALVSDTEQKKSARVLKTEVKPIAEVFVPQFIDCDNTSQVRSRDLTLDVQCERLTLKQIKLQFKGHSIQSLSIIGKILSRKFKKKVPQIRHGYDAKHSINRFKFNTPSPDDKILAHLNRNKK